MRSICSGVSRGNIWAARSITSAAIRSALREESIVGVAIRPGLANFAGRDDGMVSRSIVRGCVPMRRVVAATDVAARQADAQVDPTAANRQTFRASRRGSIDTL